jgi:uncharacterized membrane protein YfcA
VSLESLYELAGRPFEGVPVWIVVVVAVIYMLAFLLRSALGFGGLATAITFASWLLPAHHAVLLTTIAATIPQAEIMREGIRDGDWHVARPVILALALSIGIGVWGFAHLSSDWFAPILGAIISLIVLLDVTRLLDRFALILNLRSPIVAFSLAFVTGIIGGLSGAGGLLLLSVYLKQACHNHRSLRATGILIGGLLILWRTVTIAFAGLLTVQLVTESLVLLPAIYIGVWVGRSYIKLEDPKRYYLAFQSVLLVSALGLTAEGLLNLLSKS